MVFEGTQTCCSPSCAAERGCSCPLETRAITRHRSLEDETCMTIVVRQDSTSRICDREDAVSQAISKAIRVNLLANTWQILTKMIWRYVLFVYLVYGASLPSHQMSRHYQRQHVDCHFALGPPSYRSDKTVAERPTGFYLLSIYIYTPLTRDNDALPLPDRSLPAQEASIYSTIAVIEVPLTTLPCLPTLDPN